MYNDEFAGLSQTYKGPYERTQITDVNNASSMKVREYKIDLKVKLFKTNSVNDKFVLVDRNPGTPDECAQKIMQKGPAVCGNMEFMGHSTSGAHAGCYCYTYMD